MPNRLMRDLFLLVLVLLASARPTSAATLIWEGDLGGAWNAGTVGVDTNWTDGVNQVKPQDGDVLIFPAGGLNPFFSNNDIVGLDLAAIFFTGLGDGGIRYSLSGQPITLNSEAGLVFAAPDQGLSGPSVRMAMTLNTDVVISSTAFSVGQSFLGSINLNGHTLRFDLAAGFFIVSSPDVITGAGEIIKTGDGRLDFDGNNSYSGVTRVEGGLLSAGSATALGTTDAATIITDGGTLELDASVTFAEPLIISGDGSPNDINLIAGAIVVRDSTINATLAGPIFLAADALITATFFNPGNELRIAGPISGGIDADLTLAGFGSIVLTANNTYTGTTIVQGSVFVNGTQPSSPVLVDDGLLGGLGTVGSIADVGVSPSTVRPGATVNGTGVLKSGSITFGENMEFRTQLNGPTLGTDYDQLAVTGAVTLNGAALTPSIGFAPTSATSFLIVDNDGTDPVVGTFASRPEGATFLVNSQPFTISYQGGDGNDVVLSVGPFLSHFAEGATFTNDGLDFEVELAVLNPGTLEANVTLRFLKTDGSTVVSPLVVPALSRRTVIVSSIAGLEDAEFSTAIESNLPVTVERTMTWMGSGSGAHAETAVNAPALDWYLAEGATHSGFSLFYLVANANPTAVSLDITYLLPSPAPPLTKNYIVPANTRSTIWVNVEDPVLASTDVSAIIRSTNNVPVVVERAMYLDRPSEKFVAGHSSAALAAPSSTWHLAEGVTGSFFDTFVLLANPTLFDANVAVRYLGPSSEIVTRNYTVPAQTRRTVWVDFDHPLLADTAFAATVTSDVPILVERAMWWPEPHETRYEAHNSAGATALSSRWTVADVSSGGTNGAESYLVIGNSSATAANVEVTLLFEDGTGPELKTYVVAPGSRFSVNIAEQFPAAIGKRTGAIVESLLPGPNMAATPIVVERSTYSDVAGVVWDNGVNTLATRPR